MPAAFKSLKAIVSLPSFNMAIRGADTSSRLTSTLIDDAETSSCTAVWSPGTACQAWISGSAARRVGGGDQEGAAAVGARRDRRSRAHVPKRAGGRDREVVAVGWFARVDRPRHRHTVTQQIIDEPVRAQHAAILTARAGVHRDDQRPRPERRRERRGAPGDECQEYEDGEEEGSHGSLQFRGRCRRWATLRRYGFSSTSSFCSVFTRGATT